MSWSGVGEIFNPGQRHLREELDRKQVEAKIPGNEGDGVVTYAEANNVTPFGNTLNTGEVTGAQFKQIIEEQWRISDGKEAFLAFGVSENVTYAYDPTRELGDRVIDIKINGEPIDLERVWPACAGEPIDQAEHDHLAGLQAWGREHGHAAIADPRRRLDPLASPIPF